RGMAFYEAFDNVMAQVVELEVDEKKIVRLRKIVTIADPGTIFDPGIATSNLEGGVVFGLTNAMKSEITLATVRVEPASFDSYEMGLLGERAAAAEAVLVEGGAGKGGGIGEVGPVGIPPAFVNAIFAATGERVGALPLSRHGYRFA